MEIQELFQPHDTACALLAFMADQQLTCHPNWRSADACTANIQTLSRFRIGYQAVYKLATCSVALRDSISAVFPEGFVFLPAYASFRVCPALLRLTLAQAECWEFVFDSFGDMDMDMERFRVWSDIRDKLAAMPLLIVPAAATRPVDCISDETQTELLGLPLLLRLDRLRKYALNCVVCGQYGIRVLDHYRRYDDCAEPDTGYVQVEGVIRNTFDEILVGFAMRPGLICEEVKFRVTLAGNDLGDGGIGFFDVHARDAVSAARYSKSYLCLVCGYHPCYGHGHIRTALKSDDARLEVKSQDACLEVVSSSQSFDHVLQGALVSWDAVWDRVLERSAYVPHSLAQRCTDMVRISSQKRAFEYASAFALEQLQDEIMRNPEANPEHLVEELGIDPRLRADVMAHLRWEIQMNSAFENI